MQADKKRGIFGRTVYAYALLDSTNVRAAELAVQGAVEGTLVITERQSAGRGRMERVWESPAGGGLWFSLILHPAVQPAHGAQLTLVAAVAIATALRETTGIACTIKWPNDLLVAGKKLCGILSEMILDEDGIAYAIIGIGINVNLVKSDFSAEVAQAATSVYLETGRAWDKDVILREILTAFEIWYGIWLEDGFARIRVEWLKYSCSIGKSVTVKDDMRAFFSGIIVGMDTDGSLIVRSNDGITEKFDCGEIDLTN